MTISELHKSLQNAGVPENKYYLHGLYGSTDDNDKLAMTVLGGTYFIEYKIYFREKGEVHSIMKFSEEGKACNYFYKRLMESWNIEKSLSKL